VVLVTAGGQRGDPCPTAAGGEQSSRRCAGAARSRPRTGGCPGAWLVVMLVSVVGIPLGGV